MRKGSVKAIDGAVAKVLCRLESSISVQILNNMHCCTNTELADLHFLYVSAQAADLNLYLERFLGKNLLDCRPFECLHWELRINGLFCASKHDTRTYIDFLLWKKSYTQ